MANTNYTTKSVLPSQLTDAQRIQLYGPARTQLTSVSGDALTEGFNIQGLVEFILNQGISIQTGDASTGLKISSSAEGGTASLNIRVAREVHTLAAAADSATTTLDIPAGAMLLGAQFNVDTAVTTSGATNTWDADFITGSTTNVAAASTAGALNTKVNTLIVPEITSAANTEIEFDAPGAETFTAGVIEVLVYYIDLTPMDDA